MNDDYFPALIGTVGAITTLDGVKPKPRKQPIGFAPPKKKAVTRTRKKK